MIVAEGSAEPPPTSHPATGPVPFGEATRAWARVAAQSFGGPAGQIAVLHRIAVQEKRWISERRFLQALGYCMFLPGPEAQQLATYLGWTLHGVRGGLVAGGLFILPGFASILALSVVYATLGETPALATIFYGLKPAVLAIVLQALRRLRLRALRDTQSVLVAAGAFVGMAAFGVPFPAVIAAAAVAGVALGIGAGHAGPPDGTADEPGGAAGTPVARPLRTAVTWLAIWLLPVLALFAAFGPDHVFVRQAVFFSKAAVVTFGGAYAVLAYVAHHAVEVQSWLTPAEMLDGLALAETTPGPLIQVVQFVGFLGAHRSASGIDPLLAGILGSVITTWVTFAPCFFFVFVGAPLMEQLDRRPRLQAALAGITAAVVGVILNLALWFALHTLFGQVRAWSWGALRVELPVWSSIDVGAALIAALAVMLAFRLRAGMFTLLGFGVAAGLLVRSLA
jgi:chromate transporter